MAGTYAIDTARTFAGIMLAACQPKTKYGSTEQDRTAAGLPKWQVAATVMYLAEPGQVPAQPEVINVTVAAQADPCQGIAPGSPVQLDGFRVGWSAPEAREGGKVRGGRPWYQATAVHALNGHSRKADA